MSDTHTISKREYDALTEIVEAAEAVVASSAFTYGTGYKELGRLQAALAHLRTAREQVSHSSSA